MISRKIFICVLSVMVLCGCDPRYGFVESAFQLSKESRLPRFVVLPKGYSRDDVTVEFFYYTYAAGVLVKGPPPERRVLVNMKGKIQTHPVTAEKLRNSTSANISPWYNIVTFDNVQEVLEHKRQEPIVYICDDPAITKAISHGPLAVPDKK